MKQWVYLDYNWIFVFVKFDIYQSKSINVTLDKLTGAGLSSHLVCFRFSSHEQWKILQLPYLDIPLVSLAHPWSLWRFQVCLKEGSLLVCLRYGQCKIRDINFWLGGEMFLILALDMSSSLWRHESMVWNGVDLLPLGRVAIWWFQMCFCSGVKEYELNTVNHYELLTL